MQRVLSTVILLGLLAGTAAAFAITEHLKLIKSEVYGPSVTKYFSPICDCATAKAAVTFKLRHRQAVTVTIRNASGDVVATLVSGKSKPKGEVALAWDGRTNAGTPAPDGIYQPEIQLPHRNILLPDRITLDRTVPKVLSASTPRGDVFSPDGDRRADTVAIRYSLSERAHAVVYLDGKPIIRSRSRRTRGIVKWGGGSKPAGTYVLSVGSVDQEGNSTPVAERKQVVVVIRFIELAQQVIRVGSGARFSVGVDTDAPRWTWHFARRSGSRRGNALRLRAPKQSGTYRLVVAERGHSATATVVVR